MDENQPTQPLPPQPAPAGPSEPFYKRHGLAFAISTLVLACLLVLGAAGVGAFAVGSLIGHSGVSLSHLVREKAEPGRPGMPGNGGGSQGGQGGGQGGQSGQGETQRGIVRGTVTAISGSDWTIDTQRGVSVTVRTTSETAYGTPGSSERASDFATGDEVIVVGTRSGDTVTATRILKLDDFPTRPPSTPGPTAPGS